MDRARVLAELPPDMRAWLAGADRRTWEHVARDAAARSAARLFLHREAAWNGPVHRLLLAGPSPAVRTVATDLGTDPETRLSWSRGAVVAAACEWFGLHGTGAWRDVLGRAKSLQSRVPAAPAALRSA